MRNFLKIFTGICILLTLSSCATTSLQTTWVDGNFAKKTPCHVLVIAESENLPLRKGFEEGFAKAFRQQGLSVTVGDDLLPDAGDISKEKVEQAIAGKNIDLVYVMKLIEIKEKETYIPGTNYYTPYYYSSPGVWGGRFSQRPAMVSVINTPGYSYETKIVRIEHALFDTNGGKLVWSVISESVDPADAESMIKQISLKIMKDFKKRKFLMIES